MAEKYDYKTFLAILLLWVHLFLHSFDPDVVDSGLKSTVG